MADRGTTAVLLFFHRRPEALPAVYDAFAVKVRVGTITQSVLPGEPDRHRWALRLGQPREFEGVVQSLDQAKIAVQDAWLTWCE
ncbi:MAG: hypothetical protein ABWZ80_05360, partial [Beijerinckiaceae bacterium]